MLCCLAGARPGHAQLGPDTQGGPLGFPGGGAFANPFPTTPGGNQTPNFKYQSNLGPGMGAVPAPGFTVVPRISAYEEFNDNIFQSQTDRRYDLITLLLRAWRSPEIRRG